LRTPCIDFGDAHVLGGGAITVVTRMRRPFEPNRAGGSGDVSDAARWRRATLTTTQIFFDFFLAQIPRRVADGPQHRCAATRASERRSAG